MPTTSVTDQICDLIDAIYQKQHIKKTILRQNYNSFASHQDFNFQYTEMEVIEQRTIPELFNETVTVASTEMINPISKGLDATTNLSEFVQLPNCIFSILDGVLNTLDGGKLIYSSIKNPGHPAAQRAALGTGCELILQGLTIAEGGIAGFIEFFGVNVPLGAKLPYPAILIFKDMLDLMNGIREACRRRGTRKATMVLLALIVNVINPKYLSPPAFQSEATWKKNLISKYKMDIRFASFLWFCFKYRRGFFGEIRTLVLERLSLPLVALATSILTTIFVASNITSLGIPIIVLSGISSLAGFGYFFYRCGKYYQSQSALRDVLMRQHFNQHLLNTSELKLLNECLSKKHRFAGFFTLNRTLLAPGATMGDLFRFKLAVCLVNAFNQGHFFNQTDLNIDVESQDLPNIIMNFFIAGVWEVLKSDTSTRDWHLKICELQQAHDNTSEQIKIVFNMIRVNM